jgi:hypothetical protein
VGIAEIAAERDFLREPIFYFDEAAAAKYWNDDVGKGFQTRGRGIGVKNTGVSDTCRMRGKRCESTDKEK